MGDLGFVEAFARFGARPVNPMWAVSAIADDGALVVSCWAQLLKSAGRGTGVLLYTDCLSRWGGNVTGSRLLADHLAQALSGGLTVRMVVATASDPQAVDRGGDASKVRKAWPGAGSLLSLYRPCWLATSRYLCAPAQVRRHAVTHITSGGSGGGGLIRSQVLPRVAALTRSASVWQRSSKASKGSASSKSRPSSTMRW